VCVDAWRFVRGGCAAQIAKALKSFGISTERYFLFKGSLTVPPCTEDVTWYVLKDQLPISKSDLDYARKIQGDNTRPLQPGNNRVIFGIH
jgi:carbonic anhydrase